MLPIEQIVTAGHIYGAVGDLSTFYQALIVGRVVDDITGVPIGAALGVRANRAGVTVKIAPGGFFCIAGRASTVFPDPTKPYNVELELAAAGYRAAARSVVVPPSPIFPVALTDTFLRPQPVRIQGRVLDDGAARTPLAGARVAIIDPSSPVVGEHVIGLRMPLRFDHDTVGVTIRSRPFGPTGAARTLTAPALQKAVTISVSNRSGLGGNPLLRFRPADDPAVEYAVLESVSADPADLTLPGEVTLRQPLGRTHPAGTIVQKVTPDAIAATAQLARPRGPATGY